MLRSLKRCCWVALAAASLESSFAFSLLGPLNSEPYQVPEIAYQLPGDIGTPKNLGEEYRRNTPVMFYGFDANFRDYFGSNGIQAVELAISIFNGLTNVSQYSAELSEIPLQAQRENFRAEALFLLDLKSVALHLMAEQMGLAEPERYTWTLHDRLVGPAPGCPVNMTYLLIKRNFEPFFTPLDQLQPTSYVNGTLYSYFILEFCTGPPPLAEALEFRVDPLDTGFSAVAGLIDYSGLDINGGLINGRFYTGLTRDDVGGLRYMLRTNNVNLENAGADTVTFITNDAPQLLVTSNLALFVAQALTNNAAALVALYPNLIIASTTLIFTNVVTTNIVAFFRNEPFAPAGSPATLVLVTNLSTNVATYFLHTFANVVTNEYFTKSFVTTLTTNISAAPFAPPGVLQTNVTRKTTLVNQVSGDFYIIPPGLCGFSIISTQLTTVFTSTNTPVVATNAPGVTNVNGQQFSISFIYYFTNHIYVVNPVVCPTNDQSFRQGIEKIRFVRIPDTNIDPLTGLLYTSITNDYTLNAFNPTNSTLVTRRVRRTLNAPDILFSALDLADVPGNNTLFVNIAARNIQFDETTAYVGLAGPGTIVPSTTISFNKVGPVFFNASPNAYFLDTAEASAIPLLIWGSFDGTTNAPVVYPNGTSIVNLENQLLIQIQPTTLPDGRVGVPYPTTTFTATGGQPPYTWSLAPGSPGLPPGLTLSVGGRISGVPADDGTFDFVVRLTDATSRVVDFNLSIKIKP